MAVSHIVPRIHDGLRLKPVGQKRTTIDRILECAVTLSWKDLTRSEEASSIKLEYRTGPQHSLEYLKIWSSAQRGYWHLIAEYWMHSSTAHEIGATFSAGNQSADLALMLDAIMQHQEDFLPPSPDFLDGLVQIKRPGKSDLSAAREEMISVMEPYWRPTLHE